MKAAAGFAAMRAAVLARAGGFALAVAAFVAPSTLAHGAVEPREIDARVLFDDDGLLAFGGCVEGQCPPGDPHPGLDLLSLDAREGRLPDGQPVLMLSVAFQWLKEGEPDRSVRLQFMAAGQQQVVTILGADTAAPTVAGAQRVLVLPIGDGHARAVEAWFPLSTFGLALAAGGELANVTVQSRRGETLDDIMPGIWYQGGVLVPHVPHSADAGEAVEEQPPGQYALKGPAPLLDVSAPQPDSVPLPRSYTLTVRNPLANLTQAVDATVRLGTGTARIDAAGFTLAPGASQTLTLTTADVLATGEATLTLASDLGGWEAFDLPIVAPPPADTTAPAAPARDSPSPSALLPAALLAALGFRRRR